jgi:tRNA threonylcarbamoyladenosine biosynthesis protein TsaE
MELLYKTTSELATSELAQNIGRRLRGGEVFVLVSDLGGGKTAFTRGLARGASSDDLVSSPTFTLSQVYRAKEFVIHHYDLYRLDSLGLLGDEIADVLSDKTNIVVIEWPDHAIRVLPKERTIRIDFKRMKTAEHDREIVVHVPERLAYVFEGVAE